MNIIEAAKTGLPMKRPYMNKFIKKQSNGVMCFDPSPTVRRASVKAFSHRDLLATDWEVQLPPWSSAESKRCRACGCDQ